MQNLNPSAEQTENLLKNPRPCVHTKARKPFRRGVHPWRKYDCEYSQPFSDGGELHLNIGGNL